VESTELITLRSLQDFLRREPVLNSVPLGLVSRALASPEDREKLFMATVNEGDRIVAAALRFNFPKLALAAAGSTEQIRELATIVYSRMPDLPCVLGRREQSEPFARAWESIAGIVARAGMPQRLHALARVRRYRDTPGGMRLAGRQDWGLAVRWLADFEGEAIHDDSRRSQEALHETVTRAIDEGGFFLWMDTEPVSLVGGRQFGEGVARIGPVYTPPEKRRRGYAGSLTAAVSQRMLDEQCTACCLFTDLHNPTSNHIYREVGYAPVADFDEFWFSDTVGNE
jgi:predicted GNAT family acetyltransferase